MARKPVHLSNEATRDIIWQIFRERKRVSLRDLHRDTGMNRRSVRDYITGLCNAGFIKEDGTEPGLDPGSFLRKMFLLVKDAGIIAPRVRVDGTLVTQGASRRQIWATMRILGTFDFRSLAISASTEEVPVAPTEANTYCQLLAKAGYLKIITPGKPGTAANYRMLPHKYTGPRPPQIQRVKSVYDPNLKKIVWDSLEGRHD